MTLKFKCNECGDETQPCIFKIKGVKDVCEIVAYPTRCPIENTDEYTDEETQPRWIMIT